MSYPIPVSDLSDYEPEDIIKTRFDTLDADVQKFCTDPDDDLRALLDQEVVDVMDVFFPRLNKRENWTWMQAAARARGLRFHCEYNETAGSTILSTYEVKAYRIFQKFQLRKEQISNQKISMLMDGMSRLYNEKITLCTWAMHIVVQRKIHDLLGARTYADVLDKAKAIEKAPSDDEKRKNLVIVKNLLGPDLKASLTVLKTDVTNINTKERPDLAHWNERKEWTEVNFLGMLQVKDYLDFVTPTEATKLLIQVFEELFSQEIAERRAKVLLQSEAEKL